MTEDEKRGIAWWNGLTEAKRLAWLRAAGSATPADAWAESKVRAQTADGFPAQTVDEAAASLGLSDDP